MGDLVAVFQDGGVVAQFGTPAEILANPASEFVARFVGADRGLKRLALSRVSDLELVPAGHRRSSARTPRAPRRGHAATRSATSCWSTRERRPLGWIARGRHPRGRAARRRARQPGLAVGQQADDAQGRALDDARRGRAAVDRGRPDRSGPGDHDRRAGHRDDARGRARPAFAVVDERGRAEPGRARRAALVEPRRASRRWATSRSIDFGWIFSHLDDVGERVVQHIQLTIIPVFLGFVISLVLAIWAVRQPRVYGPIVAISGILYTIPSIAAFALLIPIFGLTLITAVIPLTTYTLLILVRNNASGFAAVPADVLEAAEGMGYTRWERMRRVELPLAVPLMIAGHPARGRHDDRPRDGRLDPRRLVRRARPVHHRGPPDLLPDQDLPRGGPVGRAGVPRRLPHHPGRAAADAVGHRPGGTRLMPDIVGWLIDPNNWSGDQGHPGPPHRAPPDLPARGRRGDRHRPAGRALRRAHRGGSPAWPSTSPTSAGRSRPTR